MIFVDSNFPVYLVGAPHSQKTDARRGSGRITGDYSLSMWLTTSTADSGQHPGDPDRADAIWRHVPISNKPTNSIFVNSISH